MARITEQEITKIARLSALWLSPDQVEPLTDMVEAVLTYADTLAAVDSGLAGATPYQESRTCWMRADAVRPAPEVSAILGQAPATDGTFFIVPLIITTT